MINSHGAGAGWLQGCGKPFSPFGAVVADLCWDLFSGLYHIQRAALKADWSDPDYVVVCVNASNWSTFDTDRLTKFVFLCHHYCVRGEIDAAAHNYFWLGFSPRDPMGNFYHRHPSLEEAVESFRKFYPEVSNA